MKLKNYDLWQVSTEGAEGANIMELGAHQGYIDDIAFALADQAEYTLHFSAIKKLDINPKRKMKRVNIRLDKGTGTWDLSTSERVAVFEKLLKDRPIKVEHCNYYASVTLTRKDNGRKNIS